MEDKCKTGRVTIPTDLDVVPETLEILKKWGADAIRDCDGTDFPQELKNADAKIYSTYYTTRKDNAWAKANPDEVQQCYIMTGFYTAPGNTVTIPLMKGISPELMKVNDHDDITRWWEVMDRSTGQPVPPEQWSYADGSVPVLAVDSVEGMLEFASGRTQITQGRSVSQEEYRDGAAVCLISETLARESGLDVGDTLPLSLYEKEKNLMPTMVGDSDPTASYYLPQRGFQQETEYTVIGLYRQSNEWSQGVASFTPNTVLVPRKSVTCAVETGETGLGVSSGCLWETMVLQNGTIDQMEARLKENGLGGTVTYYDQGYSDIVESLDGYNRVSRTVLLVGLALWAVVLAAYCVLLPMQESKTALRMWTLGAKRRDIAGQIWTPSALMAAAGTVIALAVSIPGMSWATDKIQALTGSDLTLKVSVGQTVALCAGALAIALAVIALVSVSTAQRGIRKAE